MRSRPSLFLFGLLAALSGRAPAEPVPAAEAVLVSARALVEATRLPEAREPLEALLARDPGNLEAALLLARVYQGIGRLDQGIELLEPRVKSHADDPRVLGAYAGQCMQRASELGMGFRALRLARRGSETMERAVALAPGEISYREGLVEFYRQAPGIAGGGLEKARRHADAIARIDPVRGGAWQAAVLLQEKKFEEALAACDAALAARPGDYLALFTLGRTAAESGRRLADGEAALQRCLKHNPAPSEPSHAGVWYRLGLIAERRGDREAARTAHRAALALEPAFRRAAEALARLEKENKD